MTKHSVYTCYMHLSRQVLEALSDYGNYIGSCQVVKYEPGSVIAYYDLKVSEGAQITSPDIRTQLISSFNYSDKPVFSRVSVDLQSFTVTSKFVCSHLMMTLRV